MAEVIANVVMKTVYQVVFEQIRLKTVSNIESGDIALDEIKDQLSTEFEKIHAKLNILLDAPFNASKRHMNDALTYLKHQEYNEAIIQFRKASEQAILAFEQSTSFDKKVVATKLRIITTLHVNNYFNPDVRNIVLIRDLVTTIWHDFLNLNEVRSSIRDEFEKNIFLRILGSNDTRKDVLSELSSIKSIVDDILGYSAVIRTANRGLSVGLYSLKPATLSGHDKSIQSMVISRGILYTGSADHTIKLWDISSGLSSISCMQTLVGHTDDVRNLIIYDNKLYSCSGDKSIKVWDISSSSESSSFPVEHTDSINSLLIYKNTLYSASHDGDIRVWDIVDRRCIAVLKGHSSWVFALVRHHHKMISSSRDHTIMIWDIISVPIVTSPIQILSGWKCCIYSMIISNDMLYGGAYDHSIKIWDLKPEMISSEPINMLHGHKGWVLSLAVTPGRLYSGSGDETMCIWDIALIPTPDKPIAVLKSHTGPVLQMTTSHGRLISGSTDKNAHMRLV